MVAAAFVGTAAAQAGVEVAIQPPGNSNRAGISMDDIPPDVTDKTYRVQSGTNTTKEVKVAAGVSVRALLDATSTNTDYATIEIRHGARSFLLLRKEQVDNQLAQPVFFADAQGRMRFIWPTADGSAIPARNYFTVPADIYLLQRAQQRLRVEISPSSKKVKPGGTITFRATTSGDRPGETVAYYWWLADKTPRRGSERHVQDFPEKKGVYGVHVSAVIEGAGVSDRGYAKITVGDPDGKDEEQADPGDRTTDSETPGDSSPASPPGSAPYTPSTTPTSPPSPTPVPTTPPPEPADPPDTPILGTTVEGNLLAAASDPPPSNILESAANAARDGSPSEDSDAGADVPEAAISIVGVLALLALGAGIENRQGRRLSLRRPRLAHR
jgi:hypothetical protein